MKNYGGTYLVTLLIFAEAGDVRKRRPKLGVETCVGRLIPIEGEVEDGDASKVKRKTGGDDRWKKGGANQTGGDGRWEGKVPRVNQI